MTKRQQRLLDACKDLLKMVGGPDGTNMPGPMDPGAVKREAAAAIADAERTITIREGIAELIEERGQGTNGIFVMEQALREVVTGTSQSVALVEIGGKLIHECEGYKKISALEHEILAKYKK